MRHGKSYPPAETNAAVSAGWMHRELAELDDRELLDVAAGAARFSQRRIAASELLVGRYRGLVWSCVQRYRARS